MESLVAIRARQSRGQSLGKQLQKLGHQSCVQAPSMEILVIWSRLQGEVGVVVSYVFPGFLGGSQLASGWVLIRCLALRQWLLKYARGPL